ncbi:MAG: glutamine amidotransferase, partial [Candidatus Desantisbacteria bacterium]
MEVDNMSTLQKTSRVLLAGEQENGNNPNAFVKALENGGHKVTWLQTNDVAVNFPESMDALCQYDVVVLSDVGADMLLLHPEMHSKAIPHPNRLKLLRDYVMQGGGVIMVGGWMSFSGIGGKGRYYDTPLEEALPVTCCHYDDRQERPEGVRPDVIVKDHPIIKGVDSQWPYFLGYN